MKVYVDDFPSREIDGVGGRVSISLIRNNIVLHLRSLYHRFELRCGRLMNCDRLLSTSSVSSKSKGIPRVMIPTTSSKLPQFSHRSSRLCEVKNIEREENLEFLINLPTHRAFFMFFLYFYNDVLGELSNDIKYSAYIHLFAEKCRFASVVSKKEEISQLPAHWKQLKYIFMTSKIRGILFIHPLTVYGNEKSTTSLRHRRENVNFYRFFCNLRDVSLYAKKVNIRIE